MEKKRASDSHKLYTFSGIMVLLHNRFYFTGYSMTPCELWEAIW